MLGKVPRKDFHKHARSPMGSIRSNNVKVLSCCSVLELRVPHDRLRGQRMVPSVPKGGNHYIADGAIRQSRLNAALVKAYGLLICVIAGMHLVVVLMKTRIVLAKLRANLVSPIQNHIHAPGHAILLPKLYQGPDITLCIPRMRQKSCSAPHFCHVVPCSMMQV
jgi:hypothetical protein